MFLPVERKTVWTLIRRLCQKTADQDGSVVFSEKDKPRPGPVAQPVASLTADLRVASLIPTLSDTFVEIDHEIILR